MPEINQNFIVTTEREAKARKIETVLEDTLGKPVKGFTILDIGTGNGEIADYFEGSNTVFAVDTLDQRVSKRSNFSLVDSEKLPYDDGSFDIVISNHVIEHTREPAAHIHEIARVMREDALCYLATPNRVFPKETHYKIWFLHYGPLAFYDCLMKRTKRYMDFVYSFTPWHLKRICSNRFQYDDYTSRILMDPEKFSLEKKYVLPIPRFMIRYLAVLSPTLIAILRKH